MNAKLALTIASSASASHTPSVSSVEIATLSPWVKREIGPWLNDRAKEGDIVNIGYALGRYWEISVKRASCWVKVCRKYAHLVQDVNSETVKAGKKRKATLSDEQSLSIADVQKHLGRNSLTFKDGYAELKVTWPLSMDWSGEVESRLSATAAFPIFCKSYVWDNTAEILTVHRARS
jgi:hypothetical protein